MSKVEHECMISKPKEKVDAKQLHSIPCKLEYTGPADINGYFLREDLDDNVQKAAFRGRGLEGKAVDMPTGYQMYILKERQMTGSRRIMDVVGEGSQFVHWEWDRESGPRSIPPRAFAHLQLAKALAED